MAANENRRRSSERPLPDLWGRRFRRGEAEAVHHVRERVRRIVSYRRIGARKHERDDLEQEIMTDLWQAVNRSGFDFEAGFWGFVETVTARRCIDWLRRTRPTALAEESIRAGVKNPLEDILNEERRSVATRLIGRLDPECRRIIMMRFGEGLSYREMARIIGRSEGALRVQMHRCIRSARDLIEESYSVPRCGLEGNESNGTS